MKHVRQSPPDIITDLTKAIEMEDSLSVLHLDISTRFHEESIRKMFQALNTFDQDHVKAMSHCLSVMMLPQAEMVG